MIKVAWSHPCAGGHKPWLLGYETYPDEPIRTARFKCRVCDAIGTARVEKDHIHLSDTKQAIRWKDTV